MTGTPRTPHADAALVVAVFGVAAVEVFTVEDVCDVGWESPAPEEEA